MADPVPEPGRPAAVRMSIILFTTILTLSALYAPQPLLPVIMQEFGVSRESAAALTTMAFVPLSVAPLVYGYLLESIRPERMLRWAVLLLAVSEVLFFFAPSFGLLLAIRLFQGLLIPAILTALMTYLAMISHGAAVQRAMAVYVCATIFGGFLGRLCSGAIASLLGWRFSFLLLAVSLFLCYALLCRLGPAAARNLNKPTLASVGAVLRNGRLGLLYSSVFCLFLVFAAIMNFLPFRLTEISDQASEFRIGLMYSGYLMGMATSLGAGWIAGRCGGEGRAMQFGLVLFGLFLIVLGAPYVSTLFLGMFFFCGAMFLIHATASGLVNRLGTANKGLANGLYVAFYYAGGTVGSYLPGLVYRHFGWGWFIAALGAGSLFCLLLVTAWLRSPGNAGGPLLRSPASPQAMATAGKDH